MVAPQGGRGRGAASLDRARPDGYREAMKQLTRPLLAGLLVSLAAALPAAAASPAPSAPADAGSDPLAEAVTFAPLGTSSILFTDWAAMKAAHGMEAVTSQTPLDERLDAMLALTKDEAPFAGYGIDRFQEHADAWGWDTTDLLWEASYSLDGPPVSVLRFREDFDWAPVVQHFDDRGFTVEMTADATIRSHEMDVTSDWIRSSDFGILNTAFLDDGRTLILSSSVDGVKAALEAPHVMTFRASPAAVAAARLEAPFSAGIELGPDSCRAYDPRIQGAGDAGDNTDLLAQAGPLGAWEAMAIGTDRDAAGEPVGRMVFAYADPGQALADLAGRMLLADQGISLRTEQPYATSVFQLTNATADDAEVILDVVPAEGASRRLQQALFARDLLFATCG